MASEFAWRQALQSLPLLDWGARYDRATFISDGIAALIVTLMLIPQSLAHSLLAGLPPEVGLVPGTAHFRNVLRHKVRVDPTILSLRVDESLYFANARALEDCINDAVANWPTLCHVVLQCSAINSIDASALESLEAIEHRLEDAGVALHLSEVKGPVMGRLKSTDFLKHLSGKVYLTHFQAVSDLMTPDPSAAVAAVPGMQGDAAMWH